MMCEKKLTINLNANNFSFQSENSIKFRSSLLFMFLTQEKKSFPSNKQNKEWRKCLAREVAALEAFALGWLLQSHVHCGELAG
jgi:hypothetical protein